MFNLFKIFKAGKDTDNNKRATTNLNILANELTYVEGLAEELSVGQIKEILAILGIRWRSMSEDEAFKEFQAILKKAGKYSRHIKLKDK